MGFEELGMFGVVLVIGYFVGCLALGGWLASEKGYSVSSWVVLLLFFGVIALIVLVGAPDRKKRGEDIGEDINDNFGVSETPKFVDTPLDNNKVQIRRLENATASALLFDVNIDDKIKFQLENGEGKILDMENGKHTISVSCDNEFDKLDFEMNTEAKKFNVFMKPPVKIEAV